MGEEAKEPETQAKEEEKKDEEKEAAKPSPPSPIILYVDLHCIGCAKKIERSILKYKGVEEVETNIEKNEVIVKGVVDPQSLCSRIQKKTSRNAKLLSPVLPPVDTTDANNAVPKAPQESGVTTVELLVNMHCEACAQQLRKKIVKMRGVQAAETDLSAKKVTVTGTMTGDKLVEHIHRRTGKIARIVPPPPPPEEKKADGDTEKKEEKDQKLPDEKKEEGKSVEEKEKEDGLKPAGGNKEEKVVGDGEKVEPKKDEVVAAAQPVGSAEEMARRMMYWNNVGGYIMNHEDEMAKRMMMMHHCMNVPMLMPTPTPAMYVYERPPYFPPPPPPPQIFSDENPNACCIS